MNKQIYIVSLLVLIFGKLEASFIEKEYNIPVRRLWHVIDPELELDAVDDDALQALGHVTVADIQHDKDYKARLKHFFARKNIPLNVTDPVVSQVHLSEVAPANDQEWQKCLSKYKNKHTTTEKKALRFWHLVDSELYDIDDEVLPLLGQERVKDVLDDKAFLTALQKYGKQNGIIFDFSDSRMSSVNLLDFLPKNQEEWNKLLQKYSTKKTAHKKVRRRFLRPHARRRRRGRLEKRIANPQIPVAEVAV